METLHQKRQCAQCHKNNNFLIVLNKCHFEICYHHFEEMGIENRFKCPVCKDHDVSLNDCLTANKNYITVKVKNMHDKLNELDKRLSKYSQTRNDTESFVYQYHTGLFEQLDKRRLHVKSEINKQIDTFYEEIKESYKLKLDKHVRFIRTNINSIEPNQKELFMNKLKQASGRPIKDQFFLIDSLMNQIEENELKIEKIDQTLTDPSEFIFVPKPDNSVRINIHNIFGRLKLKEKKILNSLDKLELKKRYFGHNKPVIGLTELISGDLISASYDHTLKVWDKDSGECMYTLSGHLDRIKDLKIVDTQIYTGGKDKCICVWKTNDRDYMKKTSVKEEVNCLAIKENGDLITGSIDGVLRTYDVELNKISELKAHQKHVYSILLLSSNIFVSCSADKTIKVWNSQSQSPIKTYEEHTDYVWCLKKVSETKFLSGSKDKRIFLWDIKKDHYEMVFDGHEDIVRCIRMKNSDEFLSCSADGRVIEWKLNDPKPNSILKRTENTNSPIYSILVTDENELFIGTGSGVLELWASNI